MISNEIQVAILNLMENDGIISSLWALSEPGSERQKLVDRALMLTRITSDVLKKVRDLGDEDALGSRPTL